MNKYLICMFILFFSGSSFSSGLGSNELKTLINGKTVESKSARGFAAITYYAPDGTFRKTERNELIKGTWQIDNSGQYCTKRDNDSTTSCRTIKKQGDVWKVYKVPGNPTKPWKHKRTWLKIIDGNPNNL